MLRSGLILCARVNLRSSPGIAVFHSTPALSSLPKAAPHEDEMPATSRPRPVLELGTKKTKKKKEINLYVPESRLDLWTKMEPRGLASAYLQLSKSKLTMLITSTAVAGFLMAPVTVSLVPLVACAAGCSSIVRRKCL